MSKNECYSKLKMVIDGDKFYEMYIKFQVFKLLQDGQPKSAYKKNECDHKFKMMIDEEKSSETHKYF
jgi:trehalose/maltose hydrolase-like predicted phosphorylase